MFMGLKILPAEAGAKMTWFMMVANATDWIDHKLQQSSPIDIEHSFYQPRFHPHAGNSHFARPPAGWFHGPWRERGCGWW
jgi:hypothetical protein